MIYSGLLCCLTTTFRPIADLTKRFLKQFSSVVVKPVELVDDEIYDPPEAGVSLNRVMQ